MNQDNSKFHATVHEALNRGRKKFYESDTYEGKREGLLIYEKGVNQLNLWMESINKLLNNHIQ